MISNCSIRYYQKEREVPSNWNGPKKNFFKDRSAYQDMSIVECDTSGVKIRVYGNEEKSIIYACSTLTTKKCDCGATYHTFDKNYKETQETDNDQ